MTPTSDKTTSGNPFSPDVTPAQGKPVLADVDKPEEVEVAMGDDAEGAVGSGAPVEAAGVDTGDA
jgi:hypothetical protein